jgi:type II secretory pathway pseudopilin PulG
VELLVVIVILAMLASLVTVAGSRAMTAARNAAIKAEIDMLHMAIMNYKNEYGSFPPCYDTTSYNVNGPAARHLSRLFPRCNTNTEFLPAVTLLPATAMSPLTAIVSWLSGFTDNPASPLLPGSNRKKLYDFDRSRLSSTSSVDIPNTQLVYHPSSKPQSPYIYINSSAYGTIAAPNHFPIQSSIHIPRAAGFDTITLESTSYTPQVQVLSSGVTFFNADTFQILCAGQDGIFSEDANMNGVLDPGEDINGNGVLDLSDDDLSNFWPGTRRDYLDSLRD